LLVNHPDDEAKRVGEAHLAALARAEAAALARA
jgi:hypothetical protein